MREIITPLFLFAMAHMFAQRTSTPLIKLQGSEMLVKASEVKIKAGRLLLKRQVWVNYGCIGGPSETSFVYGYTNSQHQYPLYDIDGKAATHYDFEKLNKNDIITIKVLKDSGATSIYGNRGENGVIVVRTKNGLTKRELRKLKRQQQRDARKQAKALK